jgi:ribosomal protein S14
MKARKLKDNKGRKQYLKHEQFVLKLKFLVRNHKQDFSALINQAPSSIAFFFCSLFDKRYTRVRQVRRCVLTNRSRGGLQLINTSRIVCRDLFSQGLLPGYTKAAW